MKKTHTFFKGRPQRPACPSQKAETTPGHSQDKGAEGKKIDTATQKDPQKLIELQPPAVDGRETQGNQQEQKKEQICQYREFWHFPPDPPKKVIDQPQYQPQPAGQKEFPSLP